MKKVLVAFSLWLLSLPISLVAPSAPSPGKVMSKNPPPPPQITPVNCILTLKFRSYVDRICGQLPTGAADPATMDGAPNMTTWTSTNYHCRITVEPNAPTSNYNAATYKFTWTKKGPSMTIKVPKETTSKITIEFYEDCNFCTLNAGFGRPVFRYTSILQKGQPSEEAILDYMNNLPC